MIGRILILPLAAVAMAAMLACAGGEPQGCVPAEGSPLLEPVDIVEAYVTGDASYTGKCVNVKVRLWRVGWDGGGVLTDTAATYADGKEGRESIRDVLIEFPSEHYLRRMFDAKGQEGDFDSTCVVQGYERGLESAGRDWKFERLTLSGCRVTDESEL